MISALVSLCVDSEHYMVAYLESISLSMLHWSVSHWTMCVCMRPTYFCMPVQIFRDPKEGSTKGACGRRLPTHLCGVGRTPLLYDSLKCAYICARIHTFIYMYVCMYVCMYVYACIIWIYTIGAGGARQSNSIWCQI
jgi:hypothetical protein